MVSIAEAMARTCTRAAVTFDRSSCAIRRGPTSAAINAMMVSTIKHFEQAVAPLGPTPAVCDSGRLLTGATIGAPDDCANQINSARKEHYATRRIGEKHSRRARLHWLMERVHQ